MRELYSGGEPAERFAYLAENLASLHASPDMAWLAGRFEFLGEKALGADLTVLAVPDERGAYRAAPTASPRPAVARDLREALGIDDLWRNEAVREAFAAAEKRTNAAPLPFAQLFGERGGEAGADCVIVAPISCDRELIGVGLFVVRNDDVTEQMANILSSHAAVAMNQLRQHEEGRRLHSVDARLWVPDEHFLLAQLRREVTRARRYGREVGLAVLRVDSEREIRARFGDFFTDHLLRRIGAQLLATVRDSDVLGALGGGYAIIHTETGLDGTELSAGRLRQVIEGMVAQRFPEVQGASISVAASAFPASGGTMEELLDRLDGGARIVPAA